MVRPYCIDLFADADLQRVCPVSAIPGPSYPGGLVEAARQAPPGPWCYTGGVENHPNLIDMLARDRPLWGNAGSVVRAVRSPERVAHVLCDAGLACPAVASGLPLAEDKTWLIKPRRSAGGKSIHRWPKEPFPRWSYAQEWIEGEPCSAFFAGSSDGSSAFLGATRQLIGIPWLHAGPFRYCGNVGPLTMNVNPSRQLERLGCILTQEFFLRGLFGVDFILQDDVAWPIEVNPRYTAGMEVVERAAGSSLFSHHLQAFAGQARMADLRVSAEQTPLPNLQSAIGNRQSMHGKAILFAKRDLVFPEDGPWQESLRSDWAGSVMPDFADIPHPQARISEGQPIMTLFAQAACAADCLQSLQDKAKALDQWLFGS